MSGVRAKLAALERRNPEWAPWLAVVSTALAEIENAAWGAAVPGHARSREAVPLLANAVLAPERALVERAFAALVQSAGAGISALERNCARRVDAAAVLENAINRDRDGLERRASECGIDPAAFSALAHLLPMPLLHACTRRQGREIPEGWMKGYCPVCGGWPAFAEVRGVERTRFLRCGACGAEWRAQGLWCVFCGTRDHDALAALVPDADGARAAIEVCSRCHGYLKVFTTLQGSPAEAVMLEDLASAELDFAAAARGYRRPQGTGYALGATLQRAG